MRRTTTFAWALVAALVALPQAVDAQVTPPARDGFFIGLGLGGGSFGCTDCGDRQTGVSGHLKLGGAMSPQLLLGVESSGWTKEEQGARLTHANLSALAQYYPVPTSGLFVKGGVGISTLETSASFDGEPISLRDTGFGMSAGMGYDIRAGNNFSVSPYGTLDWGKFEGGNATTFQLGVGVTWH